MINCALFFYSEHGQTSNLIWLSSTLLLIFRLEVANKKSLFSKSGSTWIEISCWKDIIFHGYKILYPTPGCYTGKMCLLMHQKSYKKLILNTSTWYFLSYLQFTKVGRRKGMDVIWALDSIWYIYLCTNLCTCLFMYLCEKLH